MISPDLVLIRKLTGKNIRPTFTATTVIAVTPRLMSEEMREEMSEE